MDDFDRSRIIIAAKEINKQCFVFRLPFHIVKDIIRNLDAPAKLQAREACKQFQAVIDEHWDDIPIFHSLKFFLRPSCKVKSDDIDVLKELLIEKSNRISSITWKWSIDELLEILPESMPRLEVLKLSSVSSGQLCKVYNIAPNLKDFTFERERVDEDNQFWPTVQKFKQLTALRMEDCFEMTLPNISSLMDYLKSNENLSCFAIPNMYNLTAEIATGLLTPIKNSLTELTMSVADLQGQDMLVISRCWKLRKLGLHDAVHLTEQGLVHLSKLTNLEDFQITFVDELAIDTAMRNFFVERQKNGCVPLRKLGIDTCYLLTDNGVDEILDFCPKLHTLNLSDCDKISGEFIDAWVTKCPLMVSLTLRYCSLKLSEAELKRHKENKRVKINLDYDLFNSRVKKVEPLQMSDDDNGL